MNEINAIDQVFFLRIVHFIYDNHGGEIHDGTHWYHINVLFDGQLLRKLSIHVRTDAGDIPFSKSLMASIVSNYNHRYGKANYSGHVGVL